MLPRRVNPHAGAHIFCTEARARSVRDRSGPVASIAVEILPAIYQDGRCPPSRDGASM